MDVLYLSKRSFDGRQMGWPCISKTCCLTGEIHHSHGPKETDHIRDKSFWLLAGL